MINYRTPSVERVYQRTIKARHSQPGVCPLCHPAEQEIIHQTPNFFILKNLYPYDYWDSMPVLEHLMLVPKRHTDALCRLEPEELQEYLKHICHFDQLGFNVFTRPAGSIAKSIAHQHTHLFRLEDKHIRAYIAIGKPRIKIVVK